MTETSDDGPLEKFMDSIVDEPWGTLSRAQLNILIFQLLADEKRVDLAHHDVSIANQLKTTPTRIANLRYQYDQIYSKGDTERSNSYISDLLKQTEIIISKAPANSSVGTISENPLAVYIDNKYLMNKIRQEVVDSKQIPWSGLTPNVIYIGATEFAQVFYNTFPNNTGPDSVYLQKILKPLENIKDAEDDDQLKTLQHEIVKSGLNLLPRYAKGTYEFLKALHDYHDQKQAKK